MSTGWQVACGAVCLGVSFLLSGMEAGVALVNRVRVRHWMRGGRASARVLHGYLARPEPFLWTIIIGNTLANFVAFALVTHGVMRVWGGSPWGLGLALLGVALVFYGGFDLLPKMLFRAYPTRLALAVVRPFQVVDFLLSPLVGLTAWFSRTMVRWTGRPAGAGRSFGTREELRLVMQESGGALTSAERTMINRVLDLENVRVGAIAVPMARVVSVEATEALGTALARSRERMVTRLPVWQGVGGRRRVAGMLSFKTLLYQADLDLQRAVGDFLTPALFLDGEMRLEEALRRMQRSGHRLGVVLDEEQREVGVVALQDILRSIFGEVSL